MKERICCVVGCDTPFNTVHNLKDHGLYCNRHYSQMRLYGEIKRIKNNARIPKDSKCVFCGVDNTHNKLIRFNNEIYCSKHYDHMRLYSYCKDQTIYSKNEIIIYENYAEIVLYNKLNVEKARTIIDLEDIDKVKDYKWNLGSHGYAYNTLLGKCVHNIILNTSKDKMFDHINRNKLDNRKSNLRVSNSSENSSNISIGTNNTSGIIGVTWDKNNNKWVANLQNNKNKYFKRFNKLHDAVKYRLLLEKEYFGEFAPQKHLYEEYGVETE